VHLRRLFGFTTAKSRAADAFSDESVQFHLSRRLPVPVLQSHQHCVSLCRLS